jgi:hypothetical protein
MKRALAVALLLMSFAAVAFADGSGGAPPPTQQTKPQKPAVIPLADGSGGAPPPAKPVKPTESNPVA